MLDVVADVVARALDTPHAGSLWPGLLAELEMRRRNVPDFKYMSLAYTVIAERKRLFKNLVGFGTHESKCTARSVHGPGSREPTRVQDTKAQFRHSSRPVVWSPALVGDCQHDDFIFSIEICNAEGKTIGAGTKLYKTPWHVKILNRLMGA